MEPRREEARRIARDLKIHHAVAEVLAARSFCGGNAVAEFLDPMLRQIRDPFELGGMEAAVERTLRAIRTGEGITVYGDYDVDGVASTALMVGVLRFLGAAPRYVIPHRMNDGYGMNSARVEEIAASGCTLIVTVDNGVTAVEPIRRAAELGVDVVVTDHHLAGETLPEAVALVNPNMAGSPYEGGALCGTGVAFKFAHALLKRSGIPEADSKRFLFEQLDLVALGTVADVVPLVGENRVLARHGLEALVRSRRPGIQALLGRSGYGGRRVTPEIVAFGLAPRLNAAGRTDDATRALELLLTADQREAAKLAAHLEFLNRERQKIEGSILEASLAEVEEAGEEAAFHALVVGGEGWHLGVVGIVAARLSERYGVPAIVLAIERDVAKGSARSVPGFDIHEALSACEKFLLGYGGHAAAAGLQLLPKRLPEFREALNEHAAGVFADQEHTTYLDIDGEMAPGDLTWEFFHDLQRLQPFGEGNPAPVFVMRGLRAMGTPRIVGKGHLRLRLKDSVAQYDAIGFSLGGLKEVFDGGPADVVFRPRENTFNGQTKLEMELCDARPAEAARP